MFTSLPSRETPLTPRLTVSGLAGTPASFSRETVTVALPDESSATTPGLTLTETAVEPTTGLSSPIALPRFSVNQTVPLDPVVR
jgi:hypothetical protein